ncbi:SIT4-associating protein SAP155 [Metschnikowia aff. pulcherrima]|uniref:SIT4-associating protein SAP155 n=2 Tax=Metschnikowia TaxID=27320 RepID=A0A4P6XVM6_9ASCO|nr:SIT4-associating protein SAP155 [Metschnikowia aff. pulcherrima]
MSFWPFSNPYGSSSQLQKFLDATSDMAAVTVDSLLDDKTLQQEVLDELKTISSKTLRGNSILFAQLLAPEAPNKANLALNAGSAASETLSMTSSTTDLNLGGLLLKTAREQKLLEVLLQPHILHGLLDYIVQSVDFFHELTHTKDRPEDDGSGSETLDGFVEESKKRTSEVDPKEPLVEKMQRCILAAAEILSADLWVISNRVIETPNLMGKLWLVLLLPNLQELSPALAYLVQILGHLMDLNCIELINFIRRQQGLVDTFLAKVDIPILMDFFLKVIQTDKPDSPTGILAVLARQQLVPKLMDILRPQSEGLAGDLLDPTTLFRQTAATEFIKALVTISLNPTLAVDLDTNIGPNPLTRELALPEIIKTMLHEIMLFQVSTPGGLVPNKHGIANCVAILIELIRKNNSDYDTSGGPGLQNAQSHDTPGEISVPAMCLWLKDLDSNPPGSRDPIFLGDLLRIFSDGLPALAELMHSDKCDDNVHSRQLGLTKFKIAELVAELLHCSNMILLNSGKIAHLVNLRNEIRALQKASIRLALCETISGDSVQTLPRTQIVSDITCGMDNISLESAKEDIEDSFKSNCEIDDELREKVENFSLEEAEDEEPLVSSESPFVCENRDTNFRSNPCAGDYFKIQLVDLHMLQTIVQQVTDYPWHNFFHNVVFDLTQQVFNGKLNSYNSFLIVELFDKCNITGMIADAFKHVTEPRPGYMGHLVLVSEEIVKFASLYKPSLISPLIVDKLGLQEWEWFVSDVLFKTRELYNVVLGTDPDYANGHDGVDEDKFGFDSATVGYMDLEGEPDSSHAIILGDSSNHDEFVSEPAGNVDESDGYADDYEDADDDDEPDDIEDTVETRQRILDVPIKSMSPNAEFENKDMLYEDFGGHKISFGDKYLDDFPGSSSSDEESENQLYRVPKHQE